MKHLFYIHSFIAYIVGISVVSELRLSEHDVIFVYGRGFTYKEKPEIKTAELSKALMELSHVPSYGERFLLFKRYHSITEFDRLINNLVEGEPFTAYLPLTRNYLMQLLATHSKCCDMVFIEEGLLTYTAKFNKETRKFYTDTLWGKIASVLKFPNHGNRSYYYRPYPYSQPVPVYMLHDGADNRNSAVDVRVLRSVKFPQVEPQYKVDGSGLLIVDHIVEDGIASLQNYLCVIENFISEYLHPTPNVLWVRFHPKQTIQKQILELLEAKHIEAKIIPKEVCVESMFHFSKDMTVVGLQSSLLFYAAIWGHSSYSLLKKLFEIDREAEQRYRTYLQLPSVFYDRVAML